MKKITAILALVLVQNSYALQLEGINGVDILAVNGKKVNSSLFSTSQSELDPGKHQIVVRYSTQTNDDQLLESRPAIFTIDLQQDTKISVSGMNNKQQIKRAMKKGITWQVISDDNQYPIDDSDTLVGKGFMPYSDIEGLVAQYNQSNNITLKTVEATTVATIAEESKSNANIAGEALIQLYEKASIEDKKAFRLWLVEQDMK